MSRTPRLKPRWFQYRLRTLFLLTLLGAAGMSVLSLKWRADRQRRAISQQIRSYGGDLRWDDVPWWSAEVKWASFVPYGYFKAWAAYEGDGITDDQLAELKPLLRHVEFLFLGGTEVTDSGMAHLSEMKQLKTLDLTSTAITDAGVKHLASLEKLQYLLLGCTGGPDRMLAWHARIHGRRGLKTTYKSRVTDQSLAYLTELTRLTDLDLRETEITDAGLAYLEPLDRLEHLFLDGTRVTDAGLTHLAKLTRLRDASLRDTQVTNQGIAKLRRALPDCEIFP